MVCSLVSLDFNNPTLGIKTLDDGSKDMFNFDFLEEDLVIVYLPHFINNLSRKIYLIFC